VTRITRIRLLVNERESILVLLPTPVLLEPDSTLLRVLSIDSILDSPRVEGGINLDITTEINLRPQCPVLMPFSVRWLTRGRVMQLTVLIIFLTPQHTVLTPFSPCWLTRGRVMLLTILVISLTP
jgi:hypothetical protein